MTHVMLDLETLGTKPGSIILSIGACVFTMQSGPDETKTFYGVLDTKEQESLGLTKDAKTIRWWGDHKAAWNEATARAAPVKRELLRFHKWWHQHKAVWMWCQGANFDGPLLQNLYAKFNLKEPWIYYNTRDTRTVYHMCKVPKNAIKQQGTSHNALDDAMHQARMVAFGARKIRLSKGSEK